MTIDKTIEAIVKLPDMGWLNCDVRHSADPDFFSISVTDLKALAAELTIAKQVLQFANIEILPDGSHRFKPKAVKYYCGELTAERLHKADGMANEINILTKENRDLTAERDKYRDACERLIGHYGGIEQWNSQCDQYGNFSPERDEYCHDSENGYDFARQVKAELEGIEGSEIEVDVE